MTTEITTLANGLRVVTHEMPHVETVSLGTWVGVGARHDPEPVNGIAHFLEHMAFKGTGRRTAQDIAEEIESIGGDLNAATSLESTAYYARILKGDEATALDVLADILRNSRFEADEIERERDVILQEIAATYDSPDDVVYDLAQATAYPDQPLGRTILGTETSVEAITAEELRSYLAARYAPENMVVSAAGAVRHGGVVDLVERYFGDFASGGRGEPESMGPAIYRGGATAATRPFEQCHVIIGFEGPRYGADDYFAAQVMSGLLGGGMSSRLFQEIRERRGLCYSIYSSVYGLSDTGVLTIHAATGPELADELLSVMSGEIRRLAEDGPTDAEVKRSKAQLKAGLMMGLESSAARAEQMARQLLGRDRLIGKDELVQKVDEVTPQDVKRVLHAMIGGVPTVAVVGAGARGRDCAEKAAGSLGRAA